LQSTEAELALQEAKIKLNEAQEKPKYLQSLLDEISEDDPEKIEKKEKLRRQLAEAENELEEQKQTELKLKAMFEDQN